MNIYTLEITHVQRWGAFNEYLLKHLSFYEGFNQSGTTVNISTKQELSQTEYQEMLDKIAAYTDPIIWLQLSSVEDMQMHTHAVSSSNIEVINTFINSYEKPDNSFMDSMKTIFQCETSHVEDFIDYDSTLHMNDRATFQLYDFTRNAVLKEVKPSLNTAFEYFKTQAQAGKTGHISHWQSLQLYGLGNTMPNYDCIWQFRAARETSYSNVEVSLQGIQKLYYYITP